MCRLFIDECRSYFCLVARGLILFVVYVVGAARAQSSSNLLYYISPTVFRFYSRIIAASKLEICDHFGLCC